MTPATKADPWRSDMPPPARGVLLIRHAHRHGDSPSVGLTTHGKRACITLGDALKSYRPTAILASPLKRCADTATGIIGGAKWQLAARPSTLLGDPGPFIIPAEIARTDDPCVAYARDHNDWHPLLERYARGENIPAMMPRDDGTQRLCARLFAAAGNGYLLAISHDSIIAAVMASLGLPAEPWPGYLEGVVIRRQ